MDHSPADNATGATGTTVRLKHRLRRPVPIGLPGPPSARTARADELLVEVDEDTGRAFVAGPIDLSTVEKLRPTLLHATRGGVRALTLDLSAVTVLSSVGVQLLHDLAALGPGLSLIAVPGKPAYDVLQLVGLVNHVVAADPPGTA